MKTIVTVLCIVTFSGAVVAQPSLYGLTYYDGALIAIDPVTGAGTLIGNTGLTAVGAFAADSAGGLFAIASFDELYRLDPVGSCPTLVGQVSGVMDVEELTFGPGGVLLGAASANFDARAERLITIDPSNGQSSTVGLFGAANDVDAMAYFGGDGMIYGSDLAARRWLRINPATGAAVDLGFQPNFLYGATFSPSGVLYATAHTNVEDSPSTLVTINRLTGTATVIGPVGFRSVAGLAFVSSRAACVGDVNGDLAVSLSDLTMLLAHFGRVTGATICDGDLDNDRDVDLSDLTLMLAHFGTTCP